MGHSGWIGVDLDGTLAVYDGWKGPTHIGPPVPRMLQRVRDWLLDGKTVKIVTARVGNLEERELVTARGAIERWCEEHIGEALEVTAAKDFMMIELWDDRCVQVEMNTGRAYRVEEVA